MHGQIALTFIKLLACDLIKVSPSAGIGTSVSPAVMSRR